MSDPANVAGLSGSIPLIGGSRGGRINLDDITSESSFIEPLNVVNSIMVMSEGNKNPLVHKTRDRLNDLHVGSSRAVNFPYQETAGLKKIEPEAMGARIDFPHNPPVDGKISALDPTR
jgi:hypothetical protein